MTDNVTAQPEMYAREGIYGNHVVRAMYIAITMVGISGNTVAIIVLRRSANIQRSLSSVLLINQSAVDLLSCILVVLLLTTSGLYTDIGWFGWRGLMFCWFWISDFWFYGSTVVSSYNLAALSVERAFSVARPLAHRKYVTARSLRLVCAGVWVVGFGSQLALLLPTTQLREQHGHCVDWDLFPTVTARRLYGVGFFFQAYLFPVSFLATSSITIYVKLRHRYKGESQNNLSEHIRIKKNVLKTLITVIVCYMTCNSLKAFVYLVYTLGVDIPISGTLYSTGVVIMFANSAINPIVYTFQYRDYQRELKKMFTFGAKSKIASETMFTDTANRLSHSIIPTASLECRGIAPITRSSIL